jgi:hypothetical protein
MATRNQGWSEAQHRRTSVEAPDEDGDESVEEALPDTAPASVEEPESVHKEDVPVEEPEHPKPQTTRRKPGRGNKKR